MLCVFCAFRKSDGEVTNALCSIEFLGRLDEYRGLAHARDDGRVLLRYGGFMKFKAGLPFPSLLAKHFSRSAIHTSGGGTRLERDVPNQAMGDLPDLPRRPLLHDGRQRLGQPDPGPLERRGAVLVRARRRRHQHRAAVDVGQKRRGVRLRRLPERDGLAGRAGLDTGPAAVGPVAHRLRRRASHDRGDA